MLNDEPGIVEECCAEWRTSLTVQCEGERRVQCGFNSGKRGWVKLGKMGERGRDDEAPRALGSLPLSLEATKSSQPQLIEAAARVCL